MESLYRFISFPAFINLVEQKQERYVQPTSWEDTYEGYLLRSLDKADVENCLKQLAEAICLGSAETAADNYIRLYNARWHCYGQCWTKRSESDALWRIYSYGKMSIRIETDEEQIRKVLSSATNSITIDDVHYDLDDEYGQLRAESKLLKELVLSKRIPEPYFHKRRAFEHEQEKRVIFFDPAQSKMMTRKEYSVLNNYRRSNAKDKSFEEQISMISIELKRRFNEFLQDGLSKFVSIPNIEQYIKSVMVHPQAEEWIVKLVERICKRVGLNFSGKSQMYSKIS